jgi:hypothetical protein
MRLVTESTDVSGDAPQRKLVETFQVDGMNQAARFALGGGGYCLYAPRFPAHQQAPGFADECLVFNVPMPRMFVLTLLDEKKVPVRLECVSCDLKDNQAILTYKAPGAIKVTETRFVTADDRFVSMFGVKNESKSDREFSVVMWTTTDPEGEAPSLEGDSFRIRRNLTFGEFPQVPVEIQFASPDSKGAKCLQGFFCEGESGQPDYEETPWFDMADLPVPKAKKPLVKPSPILPTSRVFLGAYRTLKLKAGASLEHRWEANVLFKRKGTVYRPRRPDAKDQTGWLAFKDKLPRFQCNDWKELEAIVNRRFLDLHLLRMPHGVGSFTNPGIAEGSGQYHYPMAFSAAAILRDARWLGDASIPRGLIKLFFENVRQSGVVPGRMFMHELKNSEFFHADWGGGFEAMDDVHPDKATKRAVIQQAQRYVKWLANNRDPEGSGLTDVVNHFEGGQEFSRRFTVIDDKADRAEEAEEQFRVKAIDASLFRYKLVRYLAKVAEELQEKAMANRYHAEVEVVAEVIKKRMWDEKAGIFMDVDPKSRRRTNVKAAVGFYPMGTDLCNAAQVEAMLKTLTDKKEFWTAYPVPSLAISDSAYDPNGHWKGTRRFGPYNGRTWPMINSQILEALCYVAERGNKQAQKVTKDLFKKTITMVSGELENLAEPRICAHYNPETGLPQRADGVDLYLHSFLVDNIFRIACGFAVRQGDIQDDPVIDDAPDFKLQNLTVGNKRYDVERRSGKLKVSPA